MLSIVQATPRYSQSYACFSASSAEERVLSPFPRFQRAITPERGWKTTAARTSTPMSNMANVIGVVIVYNRTTEMVGGSVELLEYYTRNATEVKMHKDDQHGGAPSLRPAERGEAISHSRDCPASGSRSGAESRERVVPRSGASSLENAPQCVAISPPTARHATQKSSTYRREISRTLPCASAPLSPPPAAS